MSDVISKLLQLSDGNYVRYDDVVKALQAMQGEAAAWHTEDHLTDKSATTYKADIADMWRKKGWPVTPMYYATSQPAVPDKAEPLQSNHSSWDAGFNEGWNACRDALLSAGKENDNE